MPIGKLGVRSQGAPERRGSVRELIFFQEDFSQGEVSERGICGYGGAACLLRLWKLPLLSGLEAADELRVGDGVRRRFRRNGFRAFQCVQKCLVRALALDQSEKLCVGGKSDSAARHQLLYAPVSTSEIEKHKHFAAAQRRRFFRLRRGSEGKENQVTKRFLLGRIPSL